MQLAEISIMESTQLFHEIPGRPVNFVHRKKVVSTAPGEWTRFYEGEVYEPHGYRDLEVEEDPYRINLPATTRRGPITNIERVALGDFKVTVYIDSSLCWSRRYS
ncbi:MAG: hypothetical protein ACI9XC_001600 [Gammaproteobacteria bacterium]|jgi:hypothetical protein